MSNISLYDIIFLFRFHDLLFLFCLNSQENERDDKDSDSDDSLGSVDDELIFFKVSLLFFHTHLLKLWLLAKMFFLQALDNDSMTLYYRLSKICRFELSYGAFL